MKRDLPTYCTSAKKCQDALIEQSFSAVCSGFIIRKYLKCSEVSIISHVLDSGIVHVVYRK